MRLIVGDQHKPQGLVSGRGRSRGAAMLLVLIAVAIVTILALSFLAGQGPTAVVASNIDRKAKARQIAESALKMAIDYVNEDATWRTDKTSGAWMTDAALDGGTFTLTGIDPDDGDLSDDSSEAVTLSVVATYQGVTHRVSARVTPNAGLLGMNLLLVVGDAAALTSGEQSLQVLLDNWEYTVTLIDDGASQATIDAAVDVNDVVLITRDVSDASLDTKLLDAAIGVVIAHSALHDEFGLTTGGATSDTTSEIDIAYSSHIIAEGYALGPLSIFKTPGQIDGGTGTVASGVTTLADRTGGATDATLFVAETAATLHTGAAAGRRAVFPAGAGFEAANLSIDGEILLRRTLQWASGANANSPTRIVHYEFEEQPVADPTLVGHWMLDDTAGVSGDLGNTGDGNSSDTVDEDTFASQFVLADSLDVTSMTARFKQNSDGYYRFAIYDDDAGTPGALLAESSREYFTDNGWQWRSATIGPVTLPPGTYWLALSAERDGGGSVEFRYENGGSTHYSTQNAVDNGFDDDWGTSTSTYSRRLSIYAVGTSDSPPLDDTDNDNHGVYNGDATGGATGFGDGGTSATFDGDGDYVEIAHDASYLLDEGSVSFHFYPTALGGEQGLFSKDSSGYDDGGHLTIYTDGTTLKACLQTDGSDPYGTGDDNVIESASGALSNDTWHHVTVTWGDGQFRLYLDGVLVDAANHLGGLDTTSGGTGNDEPIVIGASSQDSGDGVATPVDDFFQGRIDDLRIYDRPADGGQVANLAAGNAIGSRTAPGYVIADTAGYGDPSDLLLYDTTVASWIGGGGLQITGDTLATTVGAAAKVHDAIEANGQFTIELIMTRMTPGDTDRPSHVFGYSDTAASNFNVLVGQDDESYESRVRDSATGVTGILSPELVSTTPLNAGDTHLVISYNAGEVTTFVDGVLDETVSTAGTLDNWDPAHFLVMFGAYDGADYWHGTVKRLAIYDQAFNLNQAGNVYNGNQPGDGRGGAGTAIWDEQD